METIFRATHNEQGEPIIFTVLQVGPPKIPTEVFDGERDWPVVPLEPVPNTKFIRLIACKVVYPEDKAKSNALYLRKSRKLNY